MRLDFSIPTIFLMIVVACLIYAFTVLWVNWRDDRDGLRTWAFALSAQAAAYILFALRGTIDDFSSIVVANFLTSLSISFLLASIYIFIGKQKNGLLLWMPPTVIFIVFSIFINNMQFRLVIGCFIYSVQNVFVLYELLKADFTFNSRGRTLLYVGLAVAVLGTIYRSWVGLFHPQDMASMFQASTAQMLSYMGIFAAIMLVANGYYMMAKERSDDRLRDTAMRDRLTGCWNRIHIEELAWREMERLKRYGHPVALIMADLDHFKRINDKYGHVAGDDVLCGFARLARQLLRSADALGRWGGEEFVILLPSSGAPDAVRIAERIRLALEKAPFSSKRKVTASFGVSCCRPSDSWRDWLGRADKALYRAKSAGRNLTMVEEGNADCDAMEGEKERAPKPASREDA